MGVFGREVQPASDGCFTLTLLINFLYKYGFCLPVIQLIPPSVTTRVTSLMNHLQIILLWFPVFVSIFSTSCFSIALKVYCVVCYCSTSFSVSSSLNPVRQLPLLSIFPKCRNRGSERFSHWLKVTQLLNGRARGSEF